MIVTDPAEVRTELVRQLRSISGILTLLRSDESNIIDYGEASGGDITAAIRKLRAPKLLVYLAGVSPTRYPSRFAVSIGIAVRADQPSGIFAAMLAGTSEASGTDGLPLLVSTVHPHFDPMTLPSLERRFIPVDQNSTFDYWEISLSFTDKTS